MRLPTQRMVATNSAGCPACGSVRTLHIDGFTGARTLRCTTCESRAERAAALGQLPARPVRPRAEPPRPPAAELPRLAPWQQEALDAFAEDLGGTACDGYRFLRAVLTVAGRPLETRDIAAACGLRRWQCSERFRQAGMPSPKRYHRWLSLLALAYHLDDSSATIVQAAEALGYSSPRNMQREIRTLTGLTGTEFRRAYSGRALLELVRMRLVRPYATTLCIEPLMDVERKPGRRPKERAVA